MPDAILAPPARHFNAPRVKNTASKGPNWGSFNTIIYPLQIHLFVQFEGDCRPVFGEDELGDSSMFLDLTR